MFMDASDFDLPDDLDVGAKEVSTFEAKRGRLTEESGHSKALSSTRADGGGSGRSFSGPGRHGAELNTSFATVAAPTRSNTTGAAQRRTPNMTPPPGAPPPGISPRGSNGLTRGLSGDAASSSSNRAGGGLGLVLDVLAAEDSVVDTTLTPGSQSRARILAQQRELQLRRRQQAAAGGDGAVRLNMASVSLAHGAAAAADAASAAASAAAGANGQFTPAVKQFSSPRVLEKDPYSYSAFNGAATASGKSEFAARRVPAPDADSDDDRENNGRQAGASSGRHNKRSGSRGGNHSDDSVESRHEQGTSSGGRRGDGGRAADSRNGNAGRRDVGREAGTNGNSRHHKEAMVHDPDDEEWEVAGGGGRRGNINNGDSRSNSNSSPASRREAGNNGSTGDRGGESEGRSQQKAAVEPPRRRERTPERNNSHSSGDEEEEHSSAFERQGRVQGLKTTSAAAPGAAAAVPAAAAVAAAVAMAPGGATLRGQHAVLSDTSSYPQQTLDISDMKRALTTPCPVKAGIVQCYIRRNKTGANKLFPEYHLYMRDGDRFLMCCKKRAKNRTSNYLISMRAGDLDRESPSYLGKLRANFMGTEFTVFDAGTNPTDGGGGPSSGMVARRELACVMYASNVLGSRGPRKMQVTIPALRRDGTPELWQPDGRDREVEMLARLKLQDHSRLFYAINKPPRWNDQVGAYVLNFNGRVTMASVKNFQLVSPDYQESVVLQFGRVAKDEFTMDFQHPVSPLQAFAITLSSFDSKIACD